MRKFLVAMLLVALVGVAGCTQSGRGSDQERQGGFYGGVSGGVTR
ncbi:MAG TPA: hypothetical protein VF007_02350 [Stellaceae bacterium]